MPWTKYPTCSEENNKFVSILCQNEPGNSASLILISKIRHHELSYDGIIALQHYFGQSNKFFNEVS